MMEEFMNELATKEHRVYEPDKIEDGISKHVIRNGWQFLAVTLACWLSVFANLKWLYPGNNDLERWLLESHVHVVFGMTTLAGALLFIQLITNGNLIGRAIQNAIAASIVVAAWVVVLGIIIIGG